MAFLLEWLRGRGPDWRPRRTIESDVAQELAFHIDEATDEGVQAGMTREAARAAALERFGDVVAIKERCVRIREGGGANMVKFLAGALVAVILLSAYFFVRTRAAVAQAHEARAIAEMHLAHALEAERIARDSANAAQQQAAATAADPKSWLARFRVEPDNWRLGWAVSQELVATLSADDAAAVMLEVFPQLSVPQREQVLKPFVFHGGHARALDVLDLAYRDPAESVRQRARDYLREYAFMLFADRDPRYETWRAAVRELELREVVTAGLVELVARLRGAPGEQLRREIEELSDIDFQATCALGVDPAAVLRGAGLAEFVQSLVRVKSIQFEGEDVRAVDAEQVLEIDGAVDPKLIDQLFSAAPAHLGVVHTTLSNWLRDPCGRASGVTRGR